MDSSLNTAVAVEQAHTGVAWDAVAGGAVAAAAFTILLIAFGSGLGLAAVSPWSDSGLSAGEFRVATGVYLVLIGIMSSALGGYLAARLRTRFIGLHSNEVFFRDSAHGLLAWAFATLLTATALAAALTHIVSGAAAGLSANPQGSNPQAIYVDKLFRTTNPASAQSTPTTPRPTSTQPQGSTGAAGRHAEVLRLWTTSFAEHQDLAPDDRAYVAGLVAAQTGLSEQDARKRVDQVVTEAKAALDQARRGAAKLALWLTAALVFGAFAASLAAVEGGMLRDGSWNDRVLAPRVL